MKKIFVPFLLLISVIVAQAQPQNVVYDANAQVRTVGSFKGIHASGGIVVYVSQGSQEAVAVSSSDEKNIDKIKTEVKGGILNISISDGAWNGWNWKNNSIKAYITVKTLESIEGSGASSFRLTDRVTCDMLNVDLNGASSLKGELKAGTVKLDLSGASSASLTGESDNANIDLSGASSLRAFGFIVTTCKAEASGASSLQVGVKTQLKAEASGASSIRYKGNPSTTDTETSGASSIRKQED